MSSGKHIPLRKCVGCQEMKPKAELMRVIRTPEGTIELDLSGRKNGRGAYLCRDAQCLSMAEKNKGLQRSLKCAVDAEMVRKLLAEMEGQA